MKLVVPTKEFVEAVNWATKTLDNKDDSAYLGFTFDDSGAGTLFYTNGASYSKAPLTAISLELEEGEETVALALSAQFVKRFVGTLRNHQEPLTFTKTLSDDLTPLVATRPQETTTIPLVKARLGKTPTYEVIGTVADGEFFDALTRLSKLTDPINSGIFPSVETVDMLFNKDTKNITLMATDRYALGEIVLNYVPQEDAEFYEEKRHLLLSESRASLVSPSKGAVDNLELVFEEKARRFGYAFPDGRLILFSLSSAEPIPYEGIKKQAETTKSSALLVLDELKTALGAVAALTPEDSSVLLNFSKDGLVVSDLRSVNRRRVTLQSTEGLEEPLKVAFTRSILNEALIPVATSRVQLKWKDGRSAFVFEPVADDDTVADNVFLLAIPNQDSVE